MLWNLCLNVSRTCALISYIYFMRYFTGNPCFSHYKWGCDQWHLNEMLDYAKINSIITRKNCHKQRKHVLYKHKILMRKDFFPVSDDDQTLYQTASRNLLKRTPQQYSSLHCMPFIFQKLTLELLCTQHILMHAIHKIRPAKQCMPGFAIHGLCCQTPPHIQTQVHILQRRTAYSSQAQQI